MGIEFSSAEELYKRIKPALNSKVKELRRNKITFVKEEDIWNYLIDTKWRSDRGLELFNIVDDILNTDNETLKDYVIEKMKDFKREIKYENINIS